MIPWLVLLQATLSIAVSGPVTNPEYWPLRVADTAGYFAEQGLTVTLETPRAEAAAAEDLSRGRVDLAATSIDAALQLGQVGGAPPKLVFGLTAVPPVALLVPAALKDSVHGVADLVGKTVGLPAPGTAETVVFSSLLTAAGIRPPQVTVKSYGERRLAGALESAAVTAAVLADPYATRLIEEGRAVALIDLRKRGDADRALGQPAVHAAVFARASTALGATALEPLARALLKAIDRLRTAGPDELATILPEAAVGFPEDFRARLLGARDIYLRDGWVSPEMLKASIALVQGRTVIPARVKMPRGVGPLLLTEPLRQVRDKGR
jgi:NitT/TauT family transport system substrate-binding protein